MTGMLVSHRSEHTILQLHPINFQNGDHHEKNKSNLYYRTRQPER